MGSTPNIFQQGEVGNDLLQKEYPTKFKKSIDKLLRV
jgi:hypothetical protein